MPWHLQAIEALELEQFRRVHLEQAGGPRRRPWPIRLSGETYTKEIPLLITLQARTPSSNTWEKIGARRRNSVHGGTS